MLLSTHAKTTSHTARAAGVYAAAFVAPGLVMAATGALTGAAVPIAFLLGVFLVAVVAYFASARELVEHPQQATGDKRATVTAAAGAC